MSLAPAPPPAGGAGETGPDAFVGVLSGGGPSAGRVGQQGKPNRDTDPDPSSAPSSFAQMLAGALGSSPAGPPVHQGSSSPPANATGAGATDSPPGGAAPASATLAGSTSDVGALADASTRLPAQSPSPFLDLTATAGTMTPAADQLPGLSQALAPPATMPAGPIAGAASAVARFDQVIAAATANGAGPTERLASSALQSIVGKSAAAFSSPAQSAVQPQTLAELSGPDVAAATPTVSTSPSPAAAAPSPPAPAVSASVSPAASEPAALAPVVAPPVAAAVTGRGSGSNVAAPLQMAQAAQPSPTAPSAASVMTSLAARGLPANGVGTVPGKATASAPAQPNAVTASAAGVGDVTDLAAAMSAGAAGGDGSDKTPGDADTESQQGQGQASPTATFAATAGTAPAFQPAALVTSTGLSQTVARLSADIVKKIQAKATQFDIGLDPAGLGRVNVRIHIGADGALTAALKFDNPQSAEALKANAGDLRAALEQAGFHLEGSSLSFTSGGSGRQAGDGEPGRFRAGSAFTAAAEAADPDISIVRSTQTASGGLDLRI